MSTQPSVKAKLTQAKSTVSENEKRYLKILRIGAFNKVALFVVGSFCTYLLLIIVFVMVASFLQIEWKSAFDALLETIKIAALPVTTSVLGYYAASR